MICFLCGAEVPKGSANRRMVLTSRARNKGSGAFFASLEQRQRKYYRMQTVCAACAKVCDDEAAKPKTLLGRLWEGLRDI